MISQEAGAVSWMIQAVSGRSWNRPDTDPRVQFVDGTVEYVPAYYGGPPSVWINPVQIDRTSWTYYGALFAAIDSYNYSEKSYVCSRLAAFSVQGSFYGAPPDTCAQNLVPTDGLPLNSQYVPTNGTLFVQTTLRVRPVGGYARLFSSKVSRAD